LGYGRKGNLIYPLAPLPNVQTDYVRQVLSNFTCEKKIYRSLKRTGLIFSPGLPTKYNFTATKADIIVYAEKLENSLRDSRLSRKFRTAYEAYRSFYASIKLYWKGYEKPFPLKDILDMRINFLRDPEKYTLALKSIYNNFRNEVLNGEKRHSNLLGYYFSRDVSNFNKLQASFCLRSLPAFAGDVEPEIQNCIRRYTTVSGEYDLTEWKSWIKAWTGFYRPKTPPDFFPISVGTGACLEFSRSKGGMTFAIKNLLGARLSKTYLELFNRDVKKFEMLSLSKLDSATKNSLYLIYSCLTSVEPAIKHARECHGGCNFPSSHPPMCVLAIRERGYKVRLPTMTISPIVVLSKILRSVSDSYLRSDPRIAPSLKGVFFEKLPFKYKGGYRSQDLTVATDHHLIEMTREFYRNINPGVSVWDDIVNVVCNYYTIFSSEELELYRLMRTKYEEYFYSIKFDGHMKDRFFSNFMSKYYPDYKPEPEKELFSSSWDNLHSRIGKVSKRGQPMGVSSSWPLLPLVSLFAFETSSNAERIIITRTVSKPIPLGDNLQFSRAVDGRTEKETLSLEVPSDYRNILTTGDDAVMSMDIDHSRRHTTQLLKLGSIVSPTKDYYHKHYAIYTEIIYKDSLRLGIIPMGPFLAPFSTRFCTWYSQPKALNDIQKNFGINLRNYLKFSIFWYHWVFLAQNGVPLFAPQSIGGLNLPFKPSSRARVAGRVRFLFKSEFNSLLHLHKDLPLEKLEDQGKIYRPRPNDPKAFQAHINLRGKKDLSVRTHLVASPMVSLPIQVWDSIYRTQFSFDQLETEKEIFEEPSLYSYIRMWDIKSPMPWKDINLLYEEIHREFNELIDVPWGLCKLYRPVLGFPLPRSLNPIFYYNNREIEMRITAIEI